MIADYKKTGVDLYFDMVIENEDPQSSAGKQSILLWAVILIDCPVLDGDSDDPLKKTQTSLSKTRHSDAFNKF